MTLRLLVLGAGDSQGVPRWWCDCPVCAEARTTRHNLRHRPALLLRTPEADILIDAPPELRLQLLHHRIVRLDAVFLTHTHNDHVAGIVDLYDHVRWTQHPLPVHVPDRSHPPLLERYPFLPKHLDLRPLADPVEHLGLRVEPFVVPHGANGFAHGFRISTPDRHLAYVPDSLDLPPDLADRHLLDLDLLILGTSFRREDAPRSLRSNCDVEEALDLTARVRPRRTLFTHLGHGVDVRDPLPDGHAYARDGLQLEL